jgi:PncC family amidohydrolase
MRRMKEELILFQTLLRKMVDSGLTLSVAESCTGGLISHRITEVPGASGYFRLGVVVYANEAKRGVLGVRASTLETYGAVSEGVAREMAEGVVRVGRSDCGIGVTGIAGPEGGSVSKPVGTVFVGFHRADRQASAVERFSFGGTRSEIKRKAATAAVRSFLSFLSSVP